jgi:hypothetical protein
MLESDESSKRSGEIGQKIGVNKQFHDQYLFSSDIFLRKNFRENRRYVIVKLAVL